MRCLGCGEECDGLLMGWCEVCRRAMFLDVETTEDGVLLGGVLTSRPGRATWYDAEGLLEVIRALHIGMLMGHNLKFDLQVLARAGLEWDVLWESLPEWVQALDDTELMAYCVGFEDLRLKALETQELGLWHPTYKEVKGSGRSLRLSAVLGAWSCS